MIKHIRPVRIDSDLPTDVAIRRAILSNIHRLATAVNELISRSNIAEKQEVQNFADRGDLFATFDPNDDGYENFAGSPEDDDTTPTDYFPGDDLRGNGNGKEPGLDNGHGE